MATEFDPDSFLRDVTDRAGIVACYNAHGVVAVKNVLTKEECNATLADMGMPKSFDIRDPSTYNLPETRAALNKFGVVGTDVLWTPSLMRNRCHANVQAAYAVCKSEHPYFPIRA